MGKAAESLKDKGAAVSAVPADYMQDSSHTPEHYCSGVGAVSAPLTPPVRADVANLNS